jgi:hypothetical protein
MLGKKGEEHFDPDDPPRRRANKQRGHGTYENDRPPVVGTVGRESGQVRLRVVHHTDQKTLEAHVHHFTLADAHCSTDEWLGYDHIVRMHATVHHAEHEWARDDDGDGIREVHINTCEGMWTDVRTFCVLSKASTNVSSVVISQWPNSVVTQNASRLSS